MSSDETYLESFIDSIQTLPHDVRRNLDLLKDLDMTCGKAAVELRTLQEEFILQAEEKCMKLETIQDADGRWGVGVLGKKRQVVIPTTEEFMAYIADHEKMAKIQKLQQECLQKSDEKVAVAQQAYDMIDAKVKQLDRDLEAMEKLLQATGEFQATAMAKPDDLAACQVTPGAEWILAKVIHFDVDSGMYELADEDVESNKIFHLPESQVVVLTPLDRLSKGDVIFAVYPDTTSFYQATVVQAPRKSTSGQFVMVNFVDDSDEFGVTHDKAVPLKHIMLPPYGVTLQ